MWLVDPSPDPIALIHWLLKSANACPASELLGVSSSLNPSKIR